MIIGSIKEHNPQETRVALVPTVVKKLISLGHKIFLEPNYGDKAGFEDDLYTLAGAEFLQPVQIYKKSQIVLQILPPLARFINILTKGQILVADFRNVSITKIVAKCLFLRLEHVPRISVAQSIDILSAQNTVRGYMGAMYALFQSPRLAPQLMTAAVSIKAAEALVVGAGVTGMQASSLFKRVGCRTTILDINEKSRELAKSVGAEFVLVKNLKEIGKHLKNKSFIFTTAAMAGGKIPKIIKKEHLSYIEKNAVLIDTTAKNIDLDEKTAKNMSFFFYRDLFFERMAPITASELWANNMLNLVRLISSDVNKIDFSLNYIYPMIYPNKKEGNKSAID